MRLQDFLGTNLRYDVNKIAADDELSRQIQIRLIDLDLLAPPADGLFGPKSTAALHRFQTLTQCGEPGYLGQVTAKKLIEAKLADVRPKLILTITRDTIFKLKPLQSTELTESQKQEVATGSQFEILAFVPYRNHIRIALRNDAIKGSLVWYVFGQHGEVTEGGTLVYPKPKPASYKIPGFPYKSQLDNWYNPTGSCNVTSMAMCLQFLNVPQRKSWMQFEDELYEYALNRGYSRWDPYDLARIVRDYGAQDFFTETATIEDVQYWLASNKPVVIHGYFTTFGHIMPVLGYDPYGFYVHDPYGEWFSTGYRTDLSGASLHYSYNLIRRTCIPDGNFWVHFIWK